MERLKRLRGPAVVIALVGLALHAVLIALSAVDSPAPAGPTLGDLATRLVEPVLLVLLTGLLVSCWLVGPTRHARGLTAAGLVLTAALLVGAVAAGVASLGLGWPVGWEPSFLPGIVAPLTVAVVGCAVQVALLRRPVPDLATAAPAALTAAEPEPEPVDPGQQPTWTPDAAVGTVWRRAGDAASQRPATSWDDPPAGVEWGPGPTDGPAADRPPPAPEASASSEWSTGRSDWSTPPRPE